MIPHECALFLAYQYDLYPSHPWICYMVSERYREASADAWDSDDDEASASNSDSNEDEDSACEEDPSDTLPQQEPRLSDAEIVFGCFENSGNSDPNSISSALVIPTKSEIYGFTIKIGEITRILFDSSSNISDLTSEFVVSEAAKKPKEFADRIIISTFVNCNLDLVSLCLESVNHDSTITATVEALELRIVTDVVAVESCCELSKLHDGVFITVFDPGGALTDIVFAVKSHIRFFGHLGVWITIFDPGGNLTAVHNSSVCRLPHHQTFQKSHLPHSISSFRSPLQDTAPIPSSLLPRFQRLPRRDVFDTKSALLTLIGSVAETGGAHGRAALRNLVRNGMQEEKGKRLESSRSFARLSHEAHSGVLPLLPNTTFGLARL